MSLGNFLAELKRRKVLRVAVAYLLGGWALAQGFAQVLPVFDVSNWVVRLLVMLIVIGFPIALILSWFFDLTREGIKLTEDDAPLQTGGRPSKTLDLPPSNLPAQLSSFVGREEDIENIKRLLSNGRLLTLTGAGGSGKTRLALRVGSDLISQYSDGVWLVELGPASDPEIVTQIAAEIFGISEQPKRSLLETLEDHLRAKSLLIILDNCEHLLDACAKLADTLLKTCFGLQILATSRQALGIAGENVWQLTSLRVPGAGATMSIKSLSQFEAVRLFRDRAGAVQPRFALTAETAPAVVQICQRVEGIPLAIELAAARMSALSAAQIADRLQESFQLLAQGTRSGLPHHQAMRATIDWSYDLLSEAERMLFQRLSLFPGGFDLEAAESVCAGEEIEWGQVLDLLTQLVEKSLVLKSESHGSTRYRMLETIRQYAQDRLKESGVLTAMQKRYLAHFLRVAQEAEPHLLGPEQRAAFEKLEAEHANIFAALAWGVEHDAEETLKLANALGWFWERRGYLAEGREWLERIIAKSPEAFTNLRGEAYVRAGRLAWVQGEYVAADALTEKGLRLCEKSGNQRWRGMALDNLAAVAFYRGELDRGRSLAEQSLTIGKQLQDHDLIWRSVSDLGVIALYQGDYERARNLIEESVRVMKQCGDVDGGMTLHMLGEVEFASGNIEKAAECYEEVLKLGQGLSRKNAVAGALDGLGKVAFDRGDYARARTYYDEGLQVADELGQKSEFSISLRINLAEVAVEERKFEEARRLCLNSLRNSQEVADKESVATGLSILAWLCFVSDGQAEIATQLLGAVDQIHEALGLVLSPRQRARIERRVATIRSALDQNVFTAAWSYGKAMSMDEAVDYARARFDVDNRLSDKP